jgi:hypothetical protein
MNNALPIACALFLLPATASVSAAPPRVDDALPWRFPKISRAEASTWSNSHPTRKTPNPNEEFTVNPFVPPLAFALFLSVWADCSSGDGPADHWGRNFDTTYLESLYPQEFSRPARPDNALPPAAELLRMLRTQCGGKQPRTCFTAPQLDEFERQMAADGKLKEYVDNMLRQFHSQNTHRGFAPGKKRGHNLDYRRLGFLYHLKGDTAIADAAWQLTEQAMIDLAKPTDQFCWDAHVLGTAYDMFADAWSAERRAIFEKFLERYVDMGLKLFRNPMGIGFRVTCRTNIGLQSQAGYLTLAVALADRYPGIVQKCNALPIPYRPELFARKAPASQFLPLGRSFRRIEMGSLRAAWNSPAAWHVAFKGGYPADTHSNIHSGTFVVDALGERWITSGPGDSYDAEDAWWLGTLYLDTEVRIADDGASAVLSRNGKQIRVPLLCDMPGARFTELPMTPLPQSKAIMIEKKHWEKCMRLAVHLVNEDRLNRDGFTLRVVFEPIGGNQGEESLTPLGMWKP